MKELISVICLSWMMIMGSVTCLAATRNDTKSDYRNWNSGRATMTVTVQINTDSRSMSTVSKYWSCNGAGYSLCNTGEIDWYTTSNGRYYYGQTYIKFGGVVSQHKSM